MKSCFVLFSNGLIHVEDAEVLEAEVKKENMAKSVSLMATLVRNSLWTLFVIWREEGKRE